MALVNGNPRRTPMSQLSNARTQLQAYRETLDPHRLSAALEWVIEAIEALAEPPRPTASEERQADQTPPGAPPALQHTTWQLSVQQASVLTTDN
jgi:hypothetical protein